jgi:hypothetical protein
MVIYSGGENKMRKNLSWLLRGFLIGGSVFVSACVGYSGSNLNPGVATRADVVASMGEPAMHWKDADGREQLAYPRGPAGTQTYMAFIAVDGKLERIEPVLNMEHFSRIERDKSDKEAVLRLLGPSPSQWTMYFKARDELVWEWRFCDPWDEMAFFDVLFDATTGIVRTTYQRPDSPGSDRGANGCGQSS